MNNKKNKAPNLTPMVDVVFLLLLFFLLTVTFEKYNEVMPGSASETIGTKSDADIVLVEMGTELQLNGELISRTQLLTKVKNKTIAIRPESSVDLESFLTLSEEIRSQGAEKIIWVAGDNNAN